MNYGCPIQDSFGNGCGCPILTYHHFDPPWAGNFIHNPEGMIALCPEHHLQADAGLWTNKQLVYFKKNPFVNDIIKVKWPWQTETLVMKVGPSLVMGSGSPIRLDGSPIMRFRPHEIEDLGINAILFDAEIRDINRNKWLKIDDGWFDLRLKNTTNLLFTAQTKTILAENSDETFIKMQFKKYSLNDFRNWIESFIDKEDICRSAKKTVEDVGAIDSDGNVPVVIIEGKFKTKKVAVEIKGDKMFFESFLPGLQESFYWHSWIVDDERRAILTLDTGQEFFSLG